MRLGASVILTSLFQILCVLSALLYSQYGPSKTNMDYVLHYQEAMRIESMENLATLKVCA